jgi:hypothetical protein
MTSVFSGPDYPGTLDCGGNEWRLRTREAAKKDEPEIINLLTDPRYELPTVLPGGEVPCQEVYDRKEAAKIVCGFHRSRPIA